jgi:imidazole glycerol-phosphate synthase subunit HisH
MTIVLIDYGAGNLKSAAKALGVAAGESGAAIAVTDDPDIIRKAERIVLPGVGAFADCKRGLDAKPGLVESLREAVLERGRPFLGICVGMQLMASVGVEYGEHAGLDWIKGRVVKLTPRESGLKIPQMGWNDLMLARPAHPILAGIGEGDHVYFVHSYHFLLEERSALLASVDYGGEVASAIGRDNMLGVQFHPEKSQRVGLRFLANFLAWRP